MDINTATSSTMSTTETNVGTQPQRVKKGDTSFLEEMNKFSVEQNESTEISTEVEKTQITENTKTTDKKDTSKTTAPKGAELNVVSMNKNIENIIEPTKQNNKIQEDPIFTNTAQLAQQNVTQIVVNDKQNKTQSPEKVVPEIKQNTNKIKTEIKEHNQVKDLVNVQNKNEKQPIQNPTTDKSQIIENSIVLNPQNKEKNTLNKPVKNELSTNKVKEKTEIITKEIKTTKKVSEKISNNTLKEKVVEQTQQIIGEITTNTTPNISVAQATASTSQPAPVIDTMQTLIEANKQLANITLLTDAKVVETKVTTKTSKESIEVDYSAIKMTTEDAVFFADLVQDTEKTLQNVVANLQSEAEQKVQETSKNVKVSATLMNAISEAAKTNQPMRIDFDKDVSIIIKIDKDGAINAKFIPGDKAVEEYLKQNISALRQRFDEQELNYRDLSYSNRQKQNQEHNRKNNKERDHE